MAETWTVTEEVVTWEELVGGDSTSIGGYSYDSTVTPVAKNVLAFTGTKWAAAALDSSYITDFDEAVDDRVAVLVQDGNGISWAYNDALGTYVPTVTLNPFSTTNLAEGTNLYYTDERVDDRVNALLSVGSGLVKTYGDVGNTLDISLDDDITIAGAFSASTLTGTLQTAAQPNVTSLGAQAAHFLPNVDNGLNLGASATKWANVYATSLTGTLATAAQPNVTSLGTLTSLAVSGTSTLTGAVGIGARATVSYAGAGSTSIADVRSTSALWLQVKSGSGAGLAVGVSSSGFPTIQGMYADDATTRELILQPYGGHVHFGIDGDTNLYRSAANTLKTDDAFQAASFSGPLNGTVGATTPAAGAFTTLSASGDLTRTGGASPLLATVTSTYNVLSFVGSGSVGANVGIFGGGTGDTRLYLASNGGGWAFRGTATDPVSITDAGNIFTYGTLAVTSDFSVATSKFTVAAATGNTVVAGTLGVGSATASNTLVTQAADTAYQWIAKNAAGVTGIGFYIGGAGGIMEFGDVNLYRLSANVWQTDDSLSVAGTLTVSSSIVALGNMVLSPATASMVDVYTSSSGYGLRVVDTAYNLTMHSLTNDGAVYHAGNATIGGTLAVTGTSTLTGRVGVGSGPGAGSAMLVSYAALSGGWGDGIQVAPQWASASVTTGISSFNAYFSFTGTATVPTATSYLSNGGAVGAAILTSFIGFHAQQWPTVTTGSLTNAYGVKVDGAAGAGRWGVYVTSAASHFADVEIAGAFTVTGVSAFYGATTPGTANTYDLGSSTNEWRDLYLAGVVRFGLAQDVTLTAGAANRLDLGSGDSLYLSGGGKLGIGAVAGTSLIETHSDRASLNQHIRLVDTGTSGVTFALINGLSATAGNFSIYDVTNSREHFTVDAGRNVTAFGTLSAQSVASDAENTFGADGAHWIKLRPNSSVAATNPLVQANDKAILASSGAAIDTGALVIGLWSTVASGLRITTTGVTFAGDVRIGGAAVRATTAGANALHIFDGTAPVGTLANGVSFYSSAGEAYAMDAAGNATLLSPHDSVTNEWIFRSTHTPTGRKLTIRMEELVRRLVDRFGWDDVMEVVNA